MFKFHGCGASLNVNLRRNNFLIEICFDGICGVTFSHQC